MDKEVFSLIDFNTIEDNDYYYFFRALNIEDNNDIDSGIILNNLGNFDRIRTD